MEEEQEEEYSLAYAGFKVWLMIVILFFISTWIFWFVNNQYSTDGEDIQTVDVNNTNP